MNTTALHWLQLVELTISFGSLFLASPASLLFAWIGWFQTDRRCRSDIRTNALLGALVLASLGAGCYLFIFGFEWLVQTQESSAQKIVLDRVGIVGAISCLLGLVVVVFAKGRARVSTACAGFFGLFLFLQFTSLAYLP